VRPAASRPPNRSVESAARPAPQPTAVSTAEADAPPAVHFEPVESRPASKPLPHVEIRFPISEQRLRLSRAPRYRVRLKVDNWPMAEPAGGIQLALDENPPRVITSLREPIRLGELVAADQQLGAGAHRLFAVAVASTGEMVKPATLRSQAPFATVRFYIGERGVPVPDRPMLVYGQPRGTFNGNHAADSVLVDFYVLGARLGANAFAVQVEISWQEETWSTVLRRWQPLRVRGLPSGDHHVTLQLLAPSGERVTTEGARVQRTITINRDAPAEGGGNP
jgi:hypothetical protein